MRRVFFIIPVLVSLVLLSVPAGADTMMATVNGKRYPVSELARQVNIVSFHTHKNVPPHQSSWFRHHVSADGVSPNGDRYVCTSDDAGLAGTDVLGFRIWSYWHDASWCVDLNKSTIGPHTPDTWWGEHTHWGWVWNGTVTSRTGWAGGDWPYVYKDYRQGNFSGLIKGIPFGAQPTLSRCYYWNASAHHC